MKIYPIRNGANLPTWGTKTSACFDLAAWWNPGDTIKSFSPYNNPLTTTCDDQFILMPGHRALIPTGLIFDIPSGFSVRLHARSGFALKRGIILGNCEGIIDSDYVEEIFVMMYNMSLDSDNGFKISPGDRICQGELCHAYSIRFEFTDIRPSQKTDRQGGFGSTGKN